MNKGLSVNINVTGTEVFRGILGILKNVYNIVDEENKSVIRNELNRVIGNTHDLSDFNTKQDTVSFKISQIKNPLQFGIMYQEREMETTSIVWFDSHDERERTIESILCIGEYTKLSVSGRTGQTIRPISFSRIDSNGEFYTKC